MYEIFLTLSAVRKYRNYAMGLIEVQSLLNSFVPICVQKTSGVTIAYMAPLSQILK